MMTEAHLIRPGRHGAIFGFAGWSGSGKTTLVEKIIAHISASGVDVATIKHAHHHFDADHAGKDSYRHREAGSRQVLVSSAHRSAHFIEHGDRGEPELSTLLDQLMPADLVLVEGFKSYPIQKIEIHRPSVGKPILYPNDDLVIALASDEQISDCPLPFFDLEDVAGIASFILMQTKLKQAS
jgi:molybdopterin-guanine dinucleotide biosynthesis protein B